MSMHGIQETLQLLEVANKQISSAYLKLWKLFNLQPHTSTRHSLQELV